MIDLRQGDALRALAELADASAAAIITDPPYSSGGMTTAARQAPVASKYVQSGSRRFASADFVGDNRDQRSWTRWCALWLAEALRVTKPGGYCLVFTDWRQLPSLTDALQAAGWTWRGIVAWDKGRGARAPNVRYFRHQCEYIVWGTRGPFDRSVPAPGPLPGCLSFRVRQSDKHHVTGKPTDLMRQLVKVAPPSHLVIDPFMGSGTTGVACKLEGRAFLGIEQLGDYVAIARRRIDEAVAA